MSPWDASRSSEPGHFIVIPQASARMVPGSLEGGNMRAPYLPHRLLAYQAPAAKASKAVAVAPTRAL